jgi:hypothetical protein
LLVKIKIVDNKIITEYDYFFVVSAFILLVVSVLTILVESIGAAVVSIVLTVVESVVVASVEDDLPLQAVKKAATVKTSNNFFILFNFRFLNISYLYPYPKKVTQV